MWAGGAAGSVLSGAALDSVGEHVMSGESYRDAILRGFVEELQYEADEARLTYCFTAEPTPEIPAFQAVFLYRDDATPVLNLEDFTEGHWLPPAEVAARVAGGDPAKTNLVPTILRLAPWLARGGA